MHVKCALRLPAKQTAQDTLYLIRSFGVGMTQIVVC